MIFNVFRGNESKMWPASANTNDWRDAFFLRHPLPKRLTRRAEFLTWHAEFLTWHAEFLTWHAEFLTWRAEFRTRNLECPNMISKFYTLVRKMFTLPPIDVNWSCFVLKLGKRVSPDLRVEYFELIAWYLRALCPFFQIWLLEIILVSFLMFRNDFRCFFCS